MKPSVTVKSNAIIVNGRLYAELVEDHPVQDYLKVGTLIKTSTVLSGSVEQGMVETHNTIYVIQGDDNETV